MRTMLTLGLGALALAATAHAMPGDGNCKAPCSTTAPKPGHGAHGAVAHAAPHAAPVPHAAPAALPVAVAVTSGGACSTRSVAIAPSCSSPTRAAAVAVAPSAGGSACQAGRTGELATAIDAAFGVATAPAVLATASTAPRPAAHASGGAGQRDQRSLEQRVAELERELAQRAPPTPPATPGMPTLARLAPVAAPCPPAPPQAVDVPSPSADCIDWLDADDDEDEDEADDDFWSDNDAFDAFPDAVEHEDFEPFAFGFASGAAHDGCCDGDDTNCCADGRKVIRLGEDGTFTVGDQRVRIVTPDGKAGFFAVDADGAGGEVRVKIVSPDGKQVRTIRPGQLGTAAPDAERVEELVRRLEERGVTVRAHEERVQEQVERALAQAGLAGERAERARERVERIAAEAQHTQQRALEEALAQAGRARAFTPRAGRGDADAHGEALREVHDLMQQMRDEIEGLREELRDMRRELRSSQRDAHSDEDAIR